MPRRKNTRHVQSSRARPVLPEGSLDSSMTVDEKRQKLEIYLEDFDIEAEGRISRLKAASTIIMNKIKAAFKMEKLKYPAHVRNMKMSEFLDQGGQVNSAALKEASNVLSELANSVFQNAPRTSERAPLTSLKTELTTPAPSTKRKRGKNTEEQNEPVSTARTLRTRKRKGVPMSPSTSERQSKKAAQTDDQSMPPPTAGMRSTRRNQSKIHNQFVTPAASKLPSSYQTPFVTPKFDPRLPITPALLREVKAGERIMSMSGSPVTVRHGATDTSEAYIPLGGGQTYQLSAHDSMSPRSLPQLNETARKNIEMLQMQLSRLLKIPSQLTTNK